MVILGQETIQYYSNRLCSTLCYISQRSSMLEDVDEDRNNALARYLLYILFVLSHIRHPLLLTSNTIEFYYCKAVNY